MNKQEFIDRLAIRAHRRELKILRDIVKCYGENRSIGNIITNIEARLKELEKRVGKPKT